MCDLSRDLSSSCKPKEIGMFYKIRGMLYRISCEVFWQRVVQILKWNVLNEFIKYATRQGTLVHSRLSSLSQCILTLGLKSGLVHANWSPLKTTTTKNNNKLLRGMTCRTSRHSPHMRVKNHTTPNQANRKGQIVWRRTSRQLTFS